MSRRNAFTSTGREKLPLDSDEKATVSRAYANAARMGRTARREHGGRAHGGSAYLRATDRTNREELPCSAS